MLRERGPRLAPVEQHADVVDLTGDELLDEDPGVVDDPVGKRRATVVGGEQRLGRRRECHARRAGAGSELQHAGVVERACNLLEIAPLIHRVGGGRPQAEIACDLDGSQLVRGDGVGGVIWDGQPDDALEASATPRGGEGRVARGRQQDVVSAAREGMSEGV